MLTEDNLSQLDELYQLISPSRESSTDFNAALSSASEHIISLLEARDRPAVGSTYKELRELIVLINDCGYFERARAAEQTEEGKVLLTSSHSFSLLQILQTRFFIIIFVWKSLAGFFVLDVSLV